MYHFLLFAPLIGASLTGIFCRIIPSIFAQIITSGLIICSAIISVITFKQVVLNNQIIQIELFNWINIENLKISWQIYIDSLTSIMLIVVTFVSSLVHIYSIGYMHEDLHKQRFMAYLSLFTFCMLMLITAGNFLQLFFGWEGVGLSSYLLIGFWYEKNSANQAAIKAFIVNRVADLAFIIGIITIFIYFQSLDFQIIFEEIKNIRTDSIVIGNYQIGLIDFICMLLFIGCMGKSAQLFLHTWLPDAMEGPTPVSALIHAATMVTAGVFLLARCSSLFELSPFTRDFIIIIGASTALFAAFTALTQNDIKKIIAYSTCSQLGYMFFACGVSAYDGAIFHLMTHAFFKALLFLGAGSVIHAMSGEQDINKMGGIWRKIPITFALMMIGSLALAGIYPFAGFFSKDFILESAYISGTKVGYFAYIIGIIAAFMTAFYSWRLIIKTFHRTPNMDNETYNHVHESPIIMLIPLFILAIGAIGAGLWGEKIGIISGQINFWNGAIENGNIAEKHEIIHHLSFWIKNMPLIAGILGILFAYIIYMPGENLAKLFAKILSPFYKISYNKFYFDEIYNFLIIMPFRKLSQISWKIFDIEIIDGYGPNGTASLAREAAEQVSKLQTGLIYHYIFIIILSLTGIISWFVYNNY